LIELAWRLVIWQPDAKLVKKWWGVLGNLCRRGWRVAGTETGRYVTFQRVLIRPIVPSE